MLEAVEQELLGIMTGIFSGQIRRGLRFTEQNDFPPSYLVLSLLFVFRLEIGLEIG